jgi:predicted enzyme related to lactoylglutathione lyase
MIKFNKMRKILSYVLALTVSFYFGFTFNEIVTNQTDKQADMKRVTGVGGIFFKSEDPVKIKQWYEKHLGLQTDQWGTNFEWRQADDSTKKGFTQWSPFSESTSYFEPSQKDFMINYRVQDLEWLVDQLEKEGVKVLDEIETHEYGKFVHILDPEGNKIELWEPNDEEYDKIVEGRTK